MCLLLFTQLKWLLKKETWSLHMAQKTLRVNSRESQKCMCTYTLQHMWLENNLWGLVLSFHRVTSRD